MEPAATPRDSETVSDIESVSINKIKELADNIIKLITEGKSVTAINKRGIQSAAEDIKRILCKDPEYFQSLTASLPVLTTDSVRAIVAESNRELVQTIRAELSAAPRTVTYASVAASAPVPRAPAPRKPAIIVTPRTQSSEVKTIDTLKTQISFRNKSFAPNNYKHVSKGRVLVEFDDNVQCQEIISEINKSKDLTAEQAKRRPPLVILKGISNQVKREELIDLISRQNSGIPAESLRLCFLTHNRNPNLYNAVLEVRPAEYASFVGLERVAVDFQRVHVQAFSRFVQCRVCLQFGHTGNKCTAEVKPCAHCASVEHQVNACPKKSQPEAASCFNCAKHSKKSENNHAANNPHKCPIIKSVKAKIEESTDYGY